MSVHNGRSGRTDSLVGECPFCARVELGQYGRSSMLAVSFEPLNPVAPGHLLVAPRVHVADATVSPAITAHVMGFAALLAESVGSCNLITSVGAEATQTVRHLHIHVVPRRSGDGLKLPWSGQECPGA